MNPPALSASICSGVLRGRKRAGIGFDVQFLDVAAVGIDLDGGQHFAAFVVVAMGELVAGGDDFHADVGEQILVVVRPRAADEERGLLALRSAP